MAATRRPDPKLDRWERATLWPGIVASVVFLAAYSWVVLEPGMPAWLNSILLWVLALVWLFFVVDYAARLAIANDKATFVRRNLIDLASVVFPVARPFRLLSGLIRLHAFRGNTASHLRRRVLVIAGTFVVMFIYTISLAEYQVERDAPGASITSFGDALWWACVTMATVGYGDYYPVTVTGRLLAVVLMIGGIAIVGTASATIVSYLNERTQHVRSHRERESTQDDRPEDSSEDA